MDKQQQTIDALQRTNDELMQRLAALEKLVLGGNELGGTITDDIAAFTKLTSLDLGGMDLKGTFVVDTRARSAHATRRKPIEEFPKDLSPRHVL